MHDATHMDAHGKRMPTIPLRTLLQAVEQSPGAIVITDLHGHIEYANPGFSRLTGYALEEVLGQHTRMFASGAHSREFYQQLWKTVLSGRNWKGEVRNRKKDGSLYWEALSISPVMENGNIVHLVATKEDITGQHLMLDEQQRARKEAEKVSAMKDAFLATISHEIRTPLNIIFGFTSLIEDRYLTVVDEEDHFFFDSMRQAGERLLRTMDLLVNISSIVSGNYCPIVEEYDVITGLESLVSQFSAAAHTKRLHLEYHPRVESLFVRLDRYAFEQSMQNLIDNAIKFTHDGGVFITMHAGPRTICVEVLDTGVGMSEEFLANMFIPFSQEESGFNRHHEGLGLGLSLTKRYIEANHGTISVRSEKGRGTQFNVCFPIAV